jgi:hypothetical protein
MFNEVDMIGADVDMETSRIRTEVFYFGAAMPEMLALNLQNFYNKTEVMNVIVQGIWHSGGTHHMIIAVDTWEDGNDGDQNREAGNDPRTEPGSALPRIETALAR